MTSALTRVDVDTVSTLEAQFVKEVAQSSTHTPSPQTLFNYGWVLSKSPATADVNKGIKMLEELLVVAPSYRREALHFLAEAHFTVGDYPRAREYNEELLVIEPKNQQAMDLRVLIHDRIANDGMVGLAIVGGVAAVATAAVGLLVAVLAKKR